MTRADRVFRIQEEELTEPEKQQIVDSIIEQTNVPVPKPVPKVKLLLILVNNFPSLERNSSRNPNQ